MKTVLCPIDAMHLPMYIGRPIWIDYGNELQMRWLKGMEELRGDVVAVIGNGLGPWMSEYGWGWQAWPKKPNDNDRKAYPLGAYREKERALAV